MNTVEQVRSKAKEQFRAALLDTTLDNSIGGSISRGLSIVGALSVRPGDMVVIKPNLTTAKSAANSGVTTRPDIVAALVCAINAAQPDCQVRIIESDSDGRIEEAFDKLGYTELCRRFRNVETVDLGKQRQFKVVLPSFSKVRLVEIPEILLDMNVFISVANLKRHIQERLTCVWKNVYGLPSNHLVRMRFHPFMNQVLFDLNTLFWPDLSVIDARIGLGGAGPLAGFPMRYDKLIMSRSPLAADLAALALIGESYKEVPSIRYAARRVCVHPENLAIAGDPWSPKSLPFVSSFRFRIGRISMSIRKFSIYAENLFILGWMVGKGASMGGVSKFAGGGIQSLGTSIRLAKRVLTKLEIGEQIHG